MAIDDNTSYELTGAQVKDLASKINSKADASSVPAAQVNSDWNASSGVAEILNKPTIPTVNDATLTITQNGTSAGTFTANSATDTTIALSDTTYSAFTGTDGTAAGSAGLVPAPATTDADKYLKSDGTWATVSSGSSDAITLYCYYNSSTGAITPYYDVAHTQVVSWSDFVQLVDSKTVMLTWNDYESLPLTYVVVSSWYDRNDGGDSDFYFRIVDDYGIWQINWNSADSYFTFPGNPVIGKTEGTRCFYATSSSSTSSSSKVASIVYGQGTFSLKEGVTVFVKFSNGNTTSTTLYLNVGGTGLKQVYVTRFSSDGSYLWNENDVVGFVYDGTYWHMLGGGKATTYSYGKVKLASSYTDNSSDTVPTSSHLYSVYTIANGKQDALTAGTGISIDQSNVISATGGSYTYSGSVDTVNNSFTTSLSDGTTTQSATLNAGTGITFSSTSSGPSIVGPTPCNTSTDAPQISGLTFTPGSAGTGYFYVLRVEKSSSMSGDVYSARLYKSLNQFNFTSQAEVEAAIYPNGAIIDVNPNNSGTMSGFFDTSFQSIEYVSGKSTAAEAIAAVYTAEATFGGTVTFGQQYIDVDAYVYVMGQGASTLTISSAAPTITMTSTDPGEGGTLADNNFIFVYEA